MDRFTIKRKISDTLLGATYECERRVPTPPTASPMYPTKPTQTRARSSVAVKCSSLRRRQELLATNTQAAVAATMNTTELSPDHEVSPLFALDDPLHERRIVAKLIASGGHQNVLQCFDHFVAVSNDSDSSNTSGDQCVYIVTEFCSGGDLFRRLSSSDSGVIDQHEALKLLTQVARGVAFLRSLGFAHRDLSLENVLLRGDTCKLADFGAATDANQVCCDRVGKQQYMAPEVVAADAQSPYDPTAADVWSLGVMLFMLLTGSPLVCEASREDPRFVALEKHGVDAILRAWGLGKEHVASEVVVLLQAMLQLIPEKRISVGELVERLESTAAVLEKLELRNL